MKELLTRVKTFFTFVICCLTSLSIICLPLKIYSPSLMGQSLSQCEGACFRVGTDTHYEGVFVKGIDKKTPICGFNTRRLSENTP